MGGLDFMLQQVEIKIRDGYRCIKLKVGGMDFEKECDIFTNTSVENISEKTLSSAWMPMERLSWRMPS